MKVIVYKQVNGIPAVLTPTAEALAQRSLLEIAIKDVPAGKPFAIVEDSELPDVPQEAWEIDDADLIDGIGGESTEFESVADVDP